MTSNATITPLGSTTTTTTTTPPLGSSASSEYDPSSPYFLHHSDNPGAILVSQPLIGDNYPTWSRAVRMALEAKHKLGFIDGTIPKPDATSLHLLQWTRCNSMVLSWLLHVLSKEIANSVIYMSSAHDVWIDLQDRFSQKNAPRIFEIRRAISNHAQRNDSIATYYTVLKGLWDELSSYNSLPSCTCGAMKNIHDLHQSEHLMQFLMGLNDSFSMVRSQILLMDPLPSVSRAYSLLLQEERQRSLHVLNPHLEQSAMAASHYTPSPNNQSNRIHGKKPLYHCDYCGLDGHSISRCRKKNGNMSRKHNHSTRPPIAAAASTGSSTVTPTPLAPVTPAPALTQE